MCVVNLAYIVSIGEVKKSKLVFFVIGEKKNSLILCVCDNELPIANRYFVII